MASAMRRWRGSMETVGDRGAPVFLGVDTHSDVHVAVALDGAGRRLGALAVPNDRGGYARLWDWMLGFGTLVAAGVEGTGSYGAGLSRYVRARGASVLEVNRTSRQHRRRHGKHDVGDAEAAARAVSWLARPPGSPRAPTGPRSRCAPCASPCASPCARQ